MRIQEGVKDMARTRRAPEEMFVIQVTKEVRVVRPDSRNWAVQKRQVVKGEEQWASVGYYPNLDDALEALSKRLLQDKLAEKFFKVELPDLRDAVREACAEVHEDLQRVKFAAVVARVGA